MRMNRTMLVENTSVGEIIQVRPVGSELKASQLVTRIKTEALEIFQLIVPSGNSFQRMNFRGMSSFTAWNARCR